MDDETAISPLPSFATRNLALNGRGELGQELK
jgi:hypothetical protein